MYGNNWVEDLGLYLKNSNYSLNKLDRENML